MKAVYCLGISLIVVATLAGCKNRLETYEPYSTFDDKMAAAETGKPYPDDAYSNQFAQGSDDGDMREAAAPVRRYERSVATSNDNSEVPFASSRSSKHAMNIGAM